MALAAAARDATESGVAEVMCDLCKGFFELQWMTGTGGALSIRTDGVVYVTASGVQKERQGPRHIFRYLEEGGQELARPDADLEGDGGLKQLKVSSCLPIFRTIYRATGAGAVIHTHSIHAMLVTKLYVGHFETSHMEMIKGVPGHGYGSLLRIPIVANQPHEHQLEPAVAQVLEEEEGISAVLVRNHGIFVWGRDWRQAKAMCECLDYLFQAALLQRTAKSHL